MKTAQTVAKKESARRAGSPSMPSYLSMLEAVIEAECYSAAAIGVAADEPNATLRHAWQQAMAHRVSARQQTAVVPFSPGSTSAAWPQLAALSACGIRAAFLLSQPLALQPEAAGPFVVHALAPAMPLRLTPACFQLAAQTPQQAYDLTLIARRLAEHALLPGVLHSLQNGEPAAFEPVQTMAPEDILAFLGAPEDRIAPASPAQRQFLGASRLRLPQLPPPHWQQLQATLQVELAEHFAQAAAAFAGLTGRTYAPIELIGEKKPELAIIATTGAFAALRSDFDEIAKVSGLAIAAIHPTLGLPFPAQALADRLAGCRACLLLTDPQQDNAALLSWQVQRALPAIAHLASATLQGSNIDVGRAVELIKKLADGDAIAPGIDLSAQPVAKLPRRDRRRPAVDLNMQFPSAERLAKKLATHLYALPDLDVQLCGSPESDTMRLRLSRRKAGKGETALTNISVIGTLSGMTAKLPKDGRVLLARSQRSLQGHWLQLGEEERSAIRHHAPTLHAFANERHIDENGASIGLLSGAVLALLGQGFLSDAEIETLLTNFASNCDQQFAADVEYGQKKLARVEITALDALLHEALDTAPLPSAHPATATNETHETAPAANAAIKSQHLQFSHQGSTAPTPASPVVHLPALLHSYRDLLHQRYAYPVCLLPSQPDRIVVPLRDLFDEIAAEKAADGEAREALQRTLLRLEREIKAIMVQEPKAELATLWQQAAARLLAANAEPAALQQRREHLQAAEEALPQGAELLDCTAESPRHLLQTIASAVWRQHSGSFARELDDLIASLNELLQVDMAKTDQGRQPDRLQAALGEGYADELDLQQFSAVLRHTQTGETLQQRRRQRIEGVLQQLEVLQPAFASPKLPIIEPGSAGFGYAVAHERAAVELFRAFRIASLELDNRYREERHDRYFAAFSIDSFSEAERELTPPLLLHLRAEALDKVAETAIFDCLASGLPVKILLTFDRIDLEHGAGQMRHAGIVATAMQQGNAFVLQSSSANLRHLLDGLRQGMSYRGPALFAIFTGAAATMLPPYLDAALAHEARLFPGLRYDPAAGATWADRFSLDGNPEAEKTWSHGEFRYENADGKATTEELPLTVADYLVLQPGWRSHFAPVAPEFWHDAMVPLGVYLGLSEEDRRTKVPYLLAVGDDGLLRRLIVSAPLASAVAGTVRHWHLLRELGGIENSHAKRLLEQARAQWQEAHEKELQQQAEAHEQTMQRAVSELAEEIVANIAAGLLEQGQLPAAPTARPAPPPRPAVATPPPAVEADTEAAPEPEPAEAEDEEEALVLDDPYVETARCTSCNECTNLNPRMFAYNSEKQAYIADATAGTYRELVTAAEKCPVRIIHPGKPLDANEPGLDELRKRAEPFL